MMSKKNGMAQITVWLIIFAAAAAGAPPPPWVAGPVIGQQAARPGAATSAESAADTKSAAVTAATAEVLRETSELRKLRVLRTVRSGAQSRAEIERMVLRNINESTTPDETRAAEQILKKLGLVPADFRLRTFIVKLLAEQVAGYYDPKRQEFYLADWIDPDTHRPVMAHELTHALQDQHFNLRRFENWPKGDADAELAAHALIEGDATFTMMFYALRYPTQARAMVSGGAGAGEAGMEQFNAAPRVVRDSLLFPYEKGLLWAMQVHRRDGWEGLSKAFSELPRSTEQILHPEKYFAREMPARIEMPDISRVLGAGWRRTDYDVSGEWSLYLILDEYLKAEDESKNAAAGWGGDRYALYEAEGPDDVLVAQLSAWDTERDATEFFDAYAKRTPLRYKDATVREIRPGGGRAARRGWQTRYGSILMERRDTRVLILEGLPATVDGPALLRKLLQ